MNIDLNLARRAYVPSLRALELVFEIAKAKQEQKEGVVGRENVGARGSCFTRTHQTYTRQPPSTHTQTKTTRLISQPMIIYLRYRCVVESSPSRDDDVAETEKRDIQNRDTFIYRLRRASDMRE